MEVQDRYIKYKEYANNVIEEKIISCKWIKLLCKRYLEMFNDERFYFDDEKVDRMIKFFNLFKFFEGPKAGKKWEFIPYQEFLLYYIFGFYWKETNLRVIQKVVLYVGRKSNKSNWIALIGLYLMIFENSGSQVINVANSTKQAGILFRMMKQYVKQINNKKKFKILRDRIEFSKNSSFCQVLSSDSANLDGYAPYGLLDECENYQTSELYDGLISGQAAMDNPLIFIIGTGGFLGPGSFLYDYVETSKTVLLGLSQNDSLLPAIYTLDDEDDWKDENVWEKANPSLGITVKKEFLKQQVEDAIQNPTLEISVRTKNMNQFVQSKDVWINDKIILEKMVKKEDFDKNLSSGLSAYYGIDLSSVSDFTATARCIELDGKYYISVKCYIPFDSVEESVNSELYKLWIRQGYLTVTDGNVLDVDYVVNDLYKETDNYIVEYVGYDKWQSLTLATKATDLGMNLEEFPQSIGAFSPFNKAFEIAVRNGNIIFKYNPILRWAFQNCTLKEDANGNQKAVKGSNRDLKIDPVIAAIMSYGTCIKHSGSYNDILFLNN